MPINYLKTCHTLTKVTLVVGLILAALVGGFALRMQQGPMDLAFAKARVEAALSDAEKGYKVEIGSLGLSWPEITSPILLDLNNVRILQEGTTGLSINHVALNISELHLLRGRILPSAIVIDGPKFQLVQKDGSLNFFWEGKAESDEIKEEPKPQQSPREMRKAVRQFLERMVESHDIGALSALKHFELKQAVLTGQQFQQKSNKYIALVDISLQRHDLGLQGDLQVFLPGEEGEKAEIKSDILYRREQKDLTFTADIKSLNPARFMSFFPEQSFLMDQDVNIDGSVKAAFDQDLKLQLATLNLNVPQGNLKLKEVYDAPIPLKDIIFEMELNRPNNQLSIKNFQAIFNDIALQLKAEGKLEKRKLHLPLELNIAEIPLEKIPPIFPKSHLDSSAGEWLTQKLSNGRLHDLVLTADLHVMRDLETSKREFEVENTKLSFKAEGVTIKYSDSLMPVTNVVAEGVYENDTLKVDGKSGDIKDMTGRNVKLTMTDLSVQGGGKADINLDASGPLKTALQYVSDEPISVGDKLGFNIEEVQGSVDFNLQLNFPTVKDLPKEEVKAVLKGKVTDLVLPDVVRGLPLTGGPYDLGFQDGAITLKGSGQLSQRPITLDWLQYLDSEGRDFESKITAKITADDGLRDAFGIGLEDYISGPLPVDVVYIDKGVQATIDVKGDLAPSTLHIEPFKYRKEPSVAGDVSLKAYLKGENLEEVDQLHLTTQNFSFSNGRIRFKQLKNGDTDIAQGSIPKAKLGQTDVKADFEVTPEGVLKIVASGPVVDIAPFITVDKKSDDWKEPKEEIQKPQKISVTADKMLGDKGEVIGKSQLYLETDQQGEITRIEMDSKIGEGDMYLRFKPEEKTGKRTFRLESSDAGYTLKAFGLYDKARGGSMVVYGRPHEGDKKGNLYGTAQIEGFRVKSAPALAKLLGAMSLKGAQDLLKNDGLSFKKLKSDFEWRFRDGGNLLVIKDGRTSGSALGLTFEGVVNQAENEVDVSGTVIPLSKVNKAISDIPVLGDILTGGDCPVCRDLYNVWRSQ